MRRRIEILTLLCLTAFLFPVGVRAANPPPLTTVVNVSTVGYGTGGCSGTNGGAIRVISDTFSIPSGHSAYILPPVFTALFGSTSSTNPVYQVLWEENSTVIGLYLTYAQNNGFTTLGTFGQKIENSATLAFFNTAHAGPVAFDFTIDISTVSGQQVCVQNPYLSLALVET